jgi:protease-4
MKKFLIGLATGLVLAAVTMLLAVLAIARLGSGRPTIADGSTLVLKLHGAISEKPGMEIPLPFYEEQAPATVHEIWTALERAAADPRIKAVLLMPRRPGAGWAKLDEIRRSVLKFRKSGKPVIAWLSMPGTRDYYVATAADKIYMSREDYLDLKGLRAEAIFLKNTLEKVGVKAEIEHAGKYKDAGDIFTRSSLSPESKEVLNSVLDGVFQGLVQAIAETRNKKPEEVRAMIDRGPFLAATAKAEGLVDELKYEDEVLAELRNRLNQKELKKIGFRDYVKAAGPGEGKKRVALLVADGTILRGEGEEGILSVSFTRLLRKVAADASVAGVILRIDSPGGDGVASDEILREVRLLSQKKPLVVSMSDVAASGGYYIASSGDAIVAYPHTLTGSIGVIYGKFNLKGLYDKLGIQKEILTRGKFADVDSDYRPLSAEGRAKLREAMDAMYQSFLARVAESRKRKVDEIEPLAQGRVWLGAQARQNGLVDELGGLDKAIELVRNKAKIGKDEKVRLVVYPPKKNIIERLFTKAQETSFEAAAWTRLREAVLGFDPRLWTAGGLLRAMPYVIEVK